MKKIFSAVLCLALLSMLFACGDAGASSGDGASSGGESPSQSISEQGGENSDSVSAIPAAASLQDEIYTYGDTVEADFAKGSAGLYNAWLAAVSASTPHTETACRNAAAWQTEIDANGTYTALVDDGFFVGPYEIRAFSAGEELACAPFTVVDETGAFGAPLNVTADAGDGTPESITLSFDASAQVQHINYASVSMTVEMRLRVDGGQWFVYNIMQEALGADGHSTVNLFHYENALDNLNGVAPDAYNAVLPTLKDGKLDFANHTYEAQMRYTMYEMSVGLTQGRWTTPVGLGKDYE